ncbi:uncharacterized protein IL334_007200 [Kwoniella shivajii]|uniref:Major facilitator superfamily (MFS) profile domain-containing protein n=1 Tax=Kwoniella shivajii TaxID=564305 RepID=A0ABZ1DA54_9TREE|nr:hypothetical protein IL334_007200 [Kwoniella shivajii]
MADPYQTNSHKQTLSLHERPSSVIVNSIEAAEDQNVKQDHRPDTTAAIPRTNAKQLQSENETSRMNENPVSPSSPSQTLIPIPTSTLTITQQIIITFTLTSTCILTSSAAQMLNIALPLIKTELHMEESDLQWVLSSYNLSIGCLLLFCGRIADIYGKKKVLLVGLTVLTVFFIIGGFMQNGSGLIVTRALTGCGAAMTIPSSTGIIAELFSGKARSRVFACFSAGFSIGGILGLLIGALFVSYVRYTWRSCFFFAAGLGLLGVVLVLFTVPKDIPTIDDENKSVDWLGAALITIGLVCFLFAISDAQAAPQGWKTGYIIALLIVGISMIISFFFWEHYIASVLKKPPLMRLALWTRANGRLAILFITGFLGQTGFMACLYNATLLFQEVQKTGSVGAMLRFLPLEISGIICTIVVVIVIHKIPAYWLIVTGLLATGFGNMCFALTEEHTNYWRLPFNGMWLIVLGVDLFFPTALIYVAALSLPDEYSVASGLFQTVLRIGITVGLSSASIIFNARRNHALQQGKSENEAYLKGLQSSFWLSAAACWFGAILAAIVLRGLGVFGKEIKADPEFEATKEGEKPEQGEQLDGNNLQSVGRREKIEKV